MNGLRPRQQRSVFELPAGNVCSSFPEREGWLNWGYVEDVGGEFIMGKREYCNNLSNNDDDHSATHTCRRVFMQNFDLHVSAEHFDFVCFVRNMLTDLSSTWSLLDLCKAACTLGDIEPDTEPPAVTGEV